MTTKNPPKMTSCSAREARARLQGNYARLAAVAVRAAIAVAIATTIAVRRVLPFYRRKQDQLQLRVEKFKVH